MAEDLHRAVRRFYSRAITRGHTERAAFNAAAELVAARVPGLSLPQARRLAAQMLCWEPGPPLLPEESEQ
jgi:hypothetical protein